VNVIEFSFTTPSGEQKHFESRIVPEFTEDGSVETVLGITRDLAERVQAEAALRLQSEITANMAEGVYLIRSSNGVIVYANEKFEEMFGYDQGEMVGKHVSIVNAPTEKSPEETAREIMESLKKKGYWQGEVANIKKDGAPFWCNASVSTFDHHEHGNVLVSVHTDITERVQAEDELKNYRDNLEEKVEERTVELSSSMNNFNEKSLSASRWRRRCERVKNDTGLLLKIKQSTSTATHLTSR